MQRDNLFWLLFTLIIILIVARLRVGQKTLAQHIAAGLGPKP